MRPRQSPVDLDDQLQDPTAAAQSLEDAQDAVAGADWLARDAPGDATYIPLPEVFRRLGPKE